MRKLWRFADFLSKFSEFYSIFLNSVAKIVKKYGGIVVKNIGDSLLYYFAVSDNPEKCITNSFNCNFEIIEKRRMTHNS